MKSAEHPTLPEASSIGLQIERITKITIWLDADFINYHLIIRQGVQYTFERPIHGTVVMTMMGTVRADFHGFVNFVAQYDGMCGISE